MEPPSPHTQAWLPPSPWHRTWTRNNKTLSLSEILSPVLLGLFHWQHRDNYHRSWSEKDEMVYESNGEKLTVISYLPAVSLSLQKLGSPLNHGNRSSPPKNIVFDCLCSPWHPVWWMIHLLSCFPTHCVKTTITVLTPHLAKVQIVQRHLQQKSFYWSWAASEMQCGHWS